MLKTLMIKNIVLIDKLKLEFNKGFTERNAHHTRPFNESGQLFGKWLYTADGVTPTSLAKLLSESNSTSLESMSFTATSMSDSFTFP